MKQFILVLTLLLILSCKQTMDKAVVINERFILNEIPSASGVESANGNIFIIGDNTPFLYKLNYKFSVDKKIALINTDTIENGIFNKASKPDFEAMTTGIFDDELMLFSSGSKLPARNWVIRVSTKEDSVISIYRLDEFYDNMISTLKVNPENLNIEGAAVCNETLYLFNRGNNTILAYNVGSFKKYLENKESCPTPSITHIKLPILNNVQASFSGSSQVPGEDRILFTASLEDTKNWIDDGEVLGSYVGVIDVNELKDHYQPLCFPIMENNEMIRIKIESISVTKGNQENIYELLMVTDSDGGKSEIIKATFID